MAISLDVQNIDEYPGTVKKVAIDTEVLVTTGVEGDEKYMLTASTTAYSDITNRASIQDLYIATGKVGWTKSSGFTGTNGKFNLDTTHKSLAVKMDASTVGVSSGFYDITLTHESGMPMKGEDIAADIQTQLRGTTCSGSDVAYQLAFKNCSVKFSENRFYISSGTISNFYSGPLRSSVEVGTAQADDCAAILGFNHQVNSLSLAQTSTVETLVTSDYTVGDATLSIGLVGGVVAGDAVYITDGTNSDNFTVVSGTGPTLTVANVTNNNYNDIANNYAVADGSYIQVLQKTDPENEPDSYCKDTDALLRYMAKILINQIDFSG